MSAFLAKSDDYTYKLADNLLDAMTNGEHSRSLKQAGPAAEQGAELILEEEKKDVEVRAPTRTRQDGNGGSSTKQFEAEMKETGLSKLNLNHFFDLIPVHCFSRYSM